MKTTGLLLFLVGSLFLPLPAQAGDLPGRMVMVGSWHGDEVDAHDGETWLALTVAADGGSRLQDAVIRVEAVVDEILDAPPARSGKQVALVDGSEPLVLLRNLPQLKAGPVESAALRRAEIGFDNPGQVYFKGVLYEIGYACPAEALGQESADCPLLFSGGGRQQTLATYSVYRPGTTEAMAGSEAFLQLLWAGDLDGDGRLDLLIDLTDHYNVSAPTLLLSGSAHEDQMVRPVAAFRTTGC